MQTSNGEIETFTFSKNCENYKNCEGIRVDKALAIRYPNFSRSAIQNWIDLGNVSINSNKAKKNSTLRFGDKVQIEIPYPKKINIEPQNINLDIVYEDSNLLVINKPKAMVVHPAPGNYSNTLVNALMYHCKNSLSGINGELRPGIVHRLDKDTSGLLMVAKDDISHRFLAAQLSEHKIKREYHTVVYGHMDGEGQINAAIGRSNYDRKKMSVNAKYARSAITHYSVIKNYHDFTYLKVRLKTGRTHQIRVHMASIHHPVAGDAVYGPKKCIKKLHGQCLHAKTLAFIHPKTGKYMEFDSELPEYFLDFLHIIS